IVCGLVGRKSTVICRLWVAARNQRWLRTALVSGMGSLLFQYGVYPFVGSPSQTAGIITCSGNWWQHNRYLCARNCSYAERCSARSDFCRNRGARASFSADRTAANRSPHQPMVGTVEVTSLVYDLSVTQAAKTLFRGNNEH